MVKLASIIDDIVASVKEEESKLATANLFTADASPTISSELGQALVKVAGLMRQTSGDEISYEDLRAFMEQIRNA